MEKSGVNYQSVSELYEGKTVFITGGTGFLGKVIIEKLLRSCEKIDKIYILVRTKKNLSPQLRIQQLTNCPLFQKIKKLRPTDLNKLIPIDGDITKPKLGISEQDESILIEQVSIVLHVAASIKFNEPLKNILDINVEGARKVLNLCGRIKNLKVVVHVSTTFANTHEAVTEEKVYSPPMTLEEARRFAEENNDDPEKVKEVLAGRANTYVLSKLYIEDLIMKTSGNLPVTIVRPAIVTSAAEEPVPGWIDSWNGATGLLYASSHGLNRVVYGDANNVLDIIPVDYVSNLVIVAAAKRTSSKGIEVYNGASSGCNPIRLSKLNGLATENAIRCKNTILYPTLLYTSNKCMIVLVTILLQLLPAVILDFWQWITRNKPMYVASQKKLLVVREVLEFFTSKSLIFRADKTRALYASLSELDKMEFRFDPVNIDWDKYVPQYMRGVHTYLLSRKS